MKFRAIKEERGIRGPACFVHHGGATIACGGRMTAFALDLLLFMTDRCRTAVLAVLAIALGRLGLALAGVPA
jgi:hypothetical protein